VVYLGMPSTIVVVAAATEDYDSSGLDWTGMA
jgi:hypothetical protein